MKFGDSKSHLLLLAVEPHARRQGIGRALMEWLEKSCETAGIQEVLLEVRSRNRIARRFYHALGFKQLGRVAAYYDRRETAVILGKSLVQSNRVIGDSDRNSSDSSNLGT